MTSLAKSVLTTGIAIEAALIIVGLALAPSTMRSLVGVGEPVADFGLLLVILAASKRGPFAIARLGPSAGTCLVIAVCFAVAYNALLLTDLLGHPIAVEAYWIFIAAAVLTSGIVAYQTRTIATGILAAAWSLVLGTILWSVGWMLIVYFSWGTKGQYAFWRRDGAIADYHHSGGGSLGVFLIRDVQGSLFFHPLLSIAIGLLCGAFGALIGTLAAGTRNRLRPA